MRIEAVKKIPDLLEALIKQAEETTKKIKDKTEDPRAACPRRRLYSV
jgi:hypothetical protein